MSFEAEVIPLFIGGVIAVSAIEFLLGWLGLRRRKDVRGLFGGHVVTMLLGFFFLVRSLFANWLGVELGIASISNSVNIGLFGLLIASNAVGLLALPSSIDGFTHHLDGTKTAFSYSVDAMDRVRFMILFVVGMGYLYVLFCVLPQLLKDGRSLMFLFYAAAFVSFFAIAWSIGMEWPIYVKYFSIKTEVTASVYASSFFYNRNLFGMMLVIGIFSLIFIHNHHPHWWNFLLIGILFCELFEDRFNLGKPRLIVFLPEKHLHIAEIHRNAAVNTDNPVRCEIIFREIYRYIHDLFEDTAVFHRKHASDRHLRCIKDKSLDMRNAFQELLRPQRCDPILIEIQAGSVIIHVPQHFLLFDRHMDRPGIFQ